ncbi:EAL domain-containing protein [Fictibacillus enclensis]|uniref:EAL domain-containing protein n=1 Tax=Fictibacillus enclensis TaxID=1017270 RepID=UPI0025A081AB|nr:EAL domain-containing protein [Fictibacillus enclensis]MDM5201084.1 EAL domain-containing protein [Fictibacillus enclensis]
MFNFEESQERLDRFEFDLLPDIHRKINTGKSGAEIYLVQYIKKIEKKRRRVPALVKITSMEEGEREEAAYKMALLLASKADMNHYIPSVLDIKTFENQHAVMYEFAGAAESFTINEAVEKQMAVDYSGIINEALNFINGWGVEKKEILSPYDHMIETLGTKRWETLFHPIKELGADTNSAVLSFHGKLFPNPLVYLYNKNLWKEETMYVKHSHSHGDYHGNNIIVTDKNKSGISIIDFAELKQHTNLFYDYRYLELHLLLDCFPLESSDNQDKWMEIGSYVTRDLMKELQQPLDIPDGIAPFDKILPCFGAEFIEEVGEIAVKDYQPSYYIAGVCAGLIYARRTKINRLNRFAAFVYALFNLKKALQCLNIGLPNEVSLPLAWPADRESKELDQIIKEKLFTIYAQPIVNTLTKEMEYVEILTRFNSKSPDHWYDMARRDGRLDEITIATCEEFVRNATYLKELKIKGIFYNLEADLTKETIVKCIELLKQTQLSFTIEITEHVKKDLELWKSIAEEEGVALSLDDFGEKAATELEEITVLQPAFVKMKRNKLQEYYGAIMDLDRQYIRKMVIEHVEEEELKQLTQDGIKYVQGWLCSVAKKLKDIDADQWNAGFLKG